MARAARRASFRADAHIASAKIRSKSARVHLRGLVWWQVSLIATSTSAGMSSLVTGRLAACPDSVAGIPALNQGDGMHPNAEGERIVARNVWRALEPILR